MEYELERHIKWADKLFERILTEKLDLGFISVPTAANIKLWREWTRNHGWLETQGGMR